MLLAPGLQARGEAMVMTLDDVILRARTHSVDAEVAFNSLRSAYWNYRTYKANLLPEVSFSATVPSYSRRYSSYQNPDGTYDFVRSSALEMSAGINVTQSIWATGGTVSLSTSLDFLRQLGDNAYSRFMAVPVALRINQPIFGVNNVKWNRRTEPLRYRKSQIGFLSATESVARSAMELYFALILAREQVEIQKKNLANAEKLHEIALIKREMGKISENDVLQMELNALNARSGLTSALSSLTSASFQLSSFLGYEGDGEIIPVIPEMPPHIYITFDDVYSKAIANTDYTISRELSNLSADYSVASAKGDLRRVDLSLQVGFTGTGSEFHSAYSPLQNNQVVQVGVSIPLIDWGKRRGRVKVAESNRRVTQARLRQEETRFRQQIFVLVDRFNSQQRQVEIASLSDTIAQRRYDTNVASFSLGRISALDFDASQSAKDTQRVSYINSLYSFWSLYYQIRSTTLFDFVTQSNIDADFEKIIKEKL